MPPKQNMVQKFNFGATIRLFSLVNDINFLANLFYPAHTNMVNKYSGEAALANNQLIRKIYRFLDVIILMNLIVYWYP